MSENYLPSIPQDGFYHLTMTVTSNARADGQDTNSATVGLSRHGQVLSGYCLSCALSGNAVFTNGAQQISVTTDCRGEATVFLTDTCEETVLVACNFCQTQVCDSVSFNNRPLATIDISGEVLSNNAQADGFSRNTMRYRVYQVSGGAAVSGVTINFTVNGSAMVIPPSGTGMTDNDGLFLVSLTNDVPEDVLVTAQVPSAPGADNNTFLRFVPVSVPEYYLTSNTIMNYQPAGGASANTIVFTLTRDGAAAAGERLSFTANPPTATISAGNITNVNGNLMVNITSPTAGEVEITAVVDSQPGLQPVHVIVTFTAPAQLYFIANEVIMDHAPANNVTPNQLLFTVFSRATGTPQPGVLLTFSVNGGARLSTYTGTTLDNGTFPLNVFNTVAERVTITATIATESLTNSNVDVSFT